jgi:hypothetical protein
MVLWKPHVVREVLLHNSEFVVWCAVSAHKIIWTVFFEETNSDRSLHYACQRHLEK